jgi:hypothetical protein
MLSAAVELGAAQAAKTSMQVVGSGSQAVHIAGTVNNSSNGVSKAE